MIINIASDFTKSPGGRFIKDGDYSGEEFRLKVLEPMYKKSLEKKEKLIINFDGGYGYGTSFLEESFAGLVRSGYNGEEMLNNMVFISDEERDLVEKVIWYIKREMDNN